VRDTGPSRDRRKRLKVLRAGRTTSKALVADVEVVKSSQYRRVRAATRGSGLKVREPIICVTYLITFSCYGCHLHGDESGSVDRAHSMPGSRVVQANPKRVLAERQSMDQPPYGLDGGRRKAVLAAMLERCAARQWRLLAAHVRTTHVHMVVEGDARPERIMNDLKSYASRCLNSRGLDEPYRKRWARHGSTRWLWKPQSVSAAIRYIVEEQGDPMAVFEA
jgi:REP element-mobilizing transposase RayT